MSDTIRSPRRVYGGPVFHEGPMPASLPRLLPLSGVGREPEYERAARVALLKAAGESWTSIGKTLNKECDLALTKDAYRNLYKAYKSGVRKALPRSLERVFLQWAEQLPWASLVESSRASGIEVPMRTLRVAKCLGRRRNDDMRFEGRRLRRDGNSWGQIAIKLNPKYEKKLSADAWRKLCQERKTAAPWRKLDLNFIRGLKTS